MSLHLFETADADGMATRLTPDPASPKQLSSEIGHENPFLQSAQSHSQTAMPPPLPVSTNGTRDFKIMIDMKSGGRHSVHLVASTVQDKQAWISDIAQCMDNIHMHSMSGLVGPTGGDAV